MQNAKDTFYIALRNRLNVLNPLRTVIIRAVQRPGILVEDAEGPAATLLNDVFTIRWTGLSVTENLPTPMGNMGCEIEYATNGTQAASGLDRGRAIAEMDRELTLILKPMWTQKLNYTSTPASSLLTKVFWTEPTFSPLTSRRDQIVRLSTLSVLSFLEPGEL